MNWRNPSFTSVSTTSEDIRTVPRNIPRMAEQQAKGPQHTERLTCSPKYFQHSNISSPHSLPSEHTIQTTFSPKIQLICTPHPNDSPSVLFRPAICDSLCFQTSFRLINLRAMTRRSYTFHLNFSYPRFRYLLDFSHLVKGSDAVMR